MGRWVGSPLIDRGCPPLSGGWESQYIAEVGRRGLLLLLLCASALHGRQSSPVDPPLMPRPPPPPTPSLSICLFHSLDPSIRFRDSLLPSSIPYPPSRASTKKPTLKIGATDHGHCCQMPRAFAFSRRFLEK